MTFTFRTHIDLPDNAEIEVEVSYSYYAGRPQRLNEPQEYPEVTVTSARPVNAGEVLPDGDDIDEALEAACWADLAERSSDRWAA